MGRTLFGGSAIDSSHHHSLFLILVRVIIIWFGVYHISKAPSGAFFYLKSIDSY